MEVIKIDKGTVKEIEFSYSYTSHAYYEVKKEPGSLFDIELVYKLRSKTIEKRIDSTLFPDYFNDVSAYVMMEDGKRIGLIQFALEDWTQRLRICDFYVEQDYRGRGLGKQLMNRAKELAKEGKHRQIVLETQSTNTSAIEFYQSQGFEVAGLDLSHYLPSQVEIGEFRIEMTTSNYDS